MATKKKKSSSSSTSKKSRQSYATPKKVTTYKLSKITDGYYTSFDAKSRTSSNATVKPGTYYVYSKYNGMTNITSSPGKMGWWINPEGSSRTQPTSVNTSRGNGSSGSNISDKASSGFVSNSAGVNNDITYAKNPHYIKETKIDTPLYLTNLVTNNTLAFDVKPESFSDSNSAQFDSEDIRGRSTPIQGYSSSGPRSFNISLALYDDYLYYGIINTTKFLRALEYPSYAQGIVTPPSAHLRYGSMVSAKVIVTSVDVSWSGPVRSTSDGSQYHISASVSLGMSEIVDRPYSTSQIERGDDFVQ